MINSTDMNSSRAGRSIRLLRQAYDVVAVENLKTYMNYIRSKLKNKPQGNV